MGADKACASSAELQQHGQLVSEVERIDPDSYVFRYPITKRAELSLEQHFRFSPAATVTEMDRLAETLENFGHEIGEWLGHVFDVYLAEHGRPTADFFPKLKLSPNA